MTTTVEKPDHRRLPRAKRIPSACDQAILVAYRTQGRTQAELAEDNHLSQSRIGQIIRRTERSRANFAAQPAQVAAAFAALAGATADSSSSAPSQSRRQPEPTSDLSHPERLRLERWLERERHQAIFDRAIRTFDSAPTVLKTVRKGKRSGKTYGECVRRDIAPSSQFLRVAQRASADLGKLADKEPHPETPMTRDDRARLLIELLCEERLEAQATGCVQKSKYTRDTVIQWLCALVGDHKHLSLGSDGPDAVLREIITFYDRHRQQSLAAYPTDLDDSTLDPHDDDTTTDDTDSEDLSTPDSTLDLEPETSDATTSPANSSNAPNPASPNPAPTPLASTTSSPTPPLTPNASPKSKIPNPKSKIEDSPAARRAHQRRNLELLKEARRRGLPYHFVFDPEDGPLPPPSSPPHGYHAVEPGPY